MMTHFQALPGLIKDRFLEITATAATPAAIYYGAEKICEFTNNCIVQFNEATGTTTPIMQQDCTAWEGSEEYKKTSDQVLVPLVIISGLALAGITIKYCCSPKRVSQISNIPSEEGNNRRGSFSNINNANNATILSDDSSKKED